MSGQDDLRDLYQEMILDHHKKPRNFGKLPGANHHADGYNPLCGDRVTIYLRVEGDTIQDIRFEGSGCAICTASTSIMTETLMGKPVAEVERYFGKFRDLVMGDLENPADDEELGKLAIFAGVREYPIRVKCATLPWHTIRAALQNESEPVSTE